MCECVLWTHVDTTPHPVKGSRHVTVNILPSSAEVCLLWRSMWFSWAGIICPRSFPAGVLTTEQHGVRGDFAHSLLFLLLHTWRAFGNLGPQNMVIFFFCLGKEVPVYQCWSCSWGNQTKGPSLGPWRSAASFHRRCSVPRAPLPSASITSVRGRWECPPWAAAGATLAGSGWQPSPAPPRLWVIHTVWIIIRLGFCGSRCRHGGLWKLMKPLAWKSLLLRSRLMRRRKQEP